MRKLPSPRLLRRLLRYEPSTGKLYWRERPAWLFDPHQQNGQRTSRALWWNNRFAGTEAFTAVCGKGYLTGLVFRIPLKAHRVIWAMETGAWPINQIDHISGDKQDNRMSNLRDVDNATNCKNKSMRPSNNSGINGVRQRYYGAWVATIGVNGRFLHLGESRCIGFAACLRAVADKQYGFHKNHGRAA